MSKMKTMTLSTDTKVFRLEINNFVIIYPTISDKYNNNYVIGIILNKYPTFYPEYTLGVVWGNLYTSYWTFQSCYPEYYGKLYY
jgi:hypothetical protein